MVHVLQIGIGALGTQVLEYADAREGIRIAGVADLNPDLHGKTVQEILGRPGSSAVVSGSVQEAVEAAETEPQVAVITTVSSISGLKSQVEEAAAAGLHIVTTCEEMIYPWNQHPEAARAIDTICRDHGIACVGTGINPGFLMDYLPAVFTSVCQDVTSVTVERVQDASPRRIPFQKKIGAGLTHQAFEEEKKSGQLRHVGLPESVDLIAAAMNWTLDENRETLEPVLAKKKIGSGYRPIEKGQPAGVEQVGSGIVDGEEVIRLRFRASVGEERSYDRITINGVPDITTEVEGGVNGDTATCAITVNAVKSIDRCSPGLHTMLDIPVPAYFSA
ncbi:MAG: dihydrodipicolinate reductase [Bacteroidetes bacterium]|nr:dihydrodipicolinate reductase [Bacteroidota bacterium]